MSDYKTIFDVKDGITTHYTENEEGITLEKVQDTQPILEQNARERNSGQNNKILGGGAIGRKVASIPLVVWQQWIKETNGAVQKDPALLAKYLNDPDNKFLRTHDSRV